LLIIVTAVGFFLDWLTKTLAATHLVIGVPYKIIGHNLEFLLVYNKAALFGLNPRHLIPWFPLNEFFLVFTIVAVAILVIYYRSIKRTEIWMLWGLSLIMPGALGNLFDRVFHAQRGVVDFIKMGLSENLYWPIYNFADIYVTFGVACILVSFFIEEMKKKKAPELPAHASGTAVEERNTVVNDKPGEERTV